MKPLMTHFVVLLLIFSVSTPGFAQENRTLESLKENKKEDSEEVLKERQKFNKLKRTTRNIYKVTMRSEVAFRLQTALGYVSTIDLPEPALKVYVGDQELYKVEVYERQVLVKPITDETDARTNLIIVTKSGRLAFDVSVGDPQTADFVLDFRLPIDDAHLVKNAFDEKVKEKVTELEKGYKEKEKTLDKKAEDISKKKIKERVASGVQNVNLKKSQSEDNVQINLLSLSQVADKAYLRFSILNYSKTPYKILKASVGMVTYEKRFLRKKQAGFIELSSELELPEIIPPDSYEYGVAVFDFRPRSKKEKPVFQVLEDVGGVGAARNFEIKGFKWFT